ncbi:MAG TPA: hypothetical protein VNO84_17515 [Burkholderiaceae bacterium]|nr:hypothetical protein [Burkholderiaceae bacterium]
MNVTTNGPARQGPTEPAPWLALVDFKWLMAGQGWWVDLSRMQRDEDYARACIECALGTDCEPLRERARALQAVGASISR